MFLIRSLGMLNSISYRYLEFKVDGSTEFSSVGSQFTSLKTNCGGSSITQYLFQGQSNGRVLALVAGLDNCVSVSLLRESNSESWDFRKFLDISDNISGDLEFSLGIVMIKFQSGGLLVVNIAKEEASKERF